MASNTNANSSLLRILCIHGYRQDGQTFRERTGSLRKIIKKHAEPIYITAPNVVPPLPDSEGDDGNKSSDARGWWFSRPDDYYHAQDDTDCCKGYEESLAVVIQAFKEQGPFDGVLGFSQGASMVSLICGMLQQQGPECPFQFNFAILVAGFKSRSQPHDDLYKVPITIPTLHVFGETDRVIEKDMSEELLPYFKDPKVLRHSGGHFIPTSGPQKQAYIQFLNEACAQKKSGASIE